MLLHLDLFLKKEKAYGFEQELSIRSINFESYAFLADYHGFAPYVGIGISNDNFTVNAFDDGVAFSDLIQMNLIKLCFLAYVRV